MKKTYITKEEQMKCKKVADVFMSIYEDTDDEDVRLILDAGKYGFVELLYYYPPDGFDLVVTFTDSQKMFETLWEDWLHGQLFRLAKGQPLEEMAYEDMFQCIPVEKQEEIKNMKKSMAEKAGIRL